MQSRVFGMLFWTSGELKVVHFIFLVSLSQLLHPQATGSAHGLMTISLFLVGWSCPLYEQGLLYLPIWLHSTLVNHRRRSMRRWFGCHWSYILSTGSHIGTRKYCFYLILLNLEGSQSCFWSQREQTGFWWLTHHHLVWSEHGGLSHLHFPFTLPSCHAKLSYSLNSKLSL